LRGHVSKKTMLENFDFVLLVIDETVDRGIVMETGEGLRSLCCTPPAPCPSNTNATLLCSTLLPPCTERHHSRCPSPHPHWRFDADPCCRQPLGCNAGFHERSSGILHTAARADVLTNPRYGKDGADPQPQTVRAIQSVRLFAAHFVQPT
jgi:hypothetical protein